ncbi:ethanolamine ammonia-lyase subunit EutB, partial [Vibrio parahaemolyticus]
GCSFLICVPGSDDVMLSYQSLSHHDALMLRATMGVRPAPEFEAWLDNMGMLDAHGQVRALDAGTAPPLARLVRG